MNSFIHLQSAQLLHTCRNLRNLRYYIEYYLYHGTFSFNILQTYMLSVIHDCKIVKTPHTIIIVLYCISCWHVDTGCHKSVTNVARAT